MLKGRKKTTRTLDIYDTRDSSLLNIEDEVISGRLLILYEGEATLFDGNRSTTVKHGVTISQKDVVICGNSLVKIF